MNKKFIFFCGLLATAFTSCENPVIPNEEEPEESQGNLKISINQIEQTPFFTLTRASAGDACSRLNFAVYDEDGNRVKQVNQLSTDANFGTTTFQLAEGSYQVVVLGHSSNGNPTMTNPKKIQFTNKLGYTDTFLYSDKVAVTDESDELNVTLKRIVALCRFIITDDYPEEVAKLKFYYTGGSGAFDATTGLGSVNSIQDVEFDITDSQKQFDLYTFLHSTEGTIHLKVTALDGGDNIVSEREFDVPMKQNEITWFSGAFFTGGSSGSTGISIVINTDWDSESHYTF